MFSSLQYVTILGYEKTSAVHYDTILEDQDCECFERHRPPDQESNEENKDQEYNKKDRNHWSKDENNDKGYNKKDTQHWSNENSKDQGYTRENHSWWGDFKKDLCPCSEKLCPKVPRDDSECPKDDEHFPKDDPHEEVQVILDINTLIRNIPGW